MMNDVEMKPALAATPPQETFRLLPGHHAVLLGTLALLLAFISVWVLEPLPFLPWSGTVHTPLLPHVLSGVLLGAVALFAPFLISVQAMDETLPRRLARAGYVSLWVAVIELFALLVASRLVPLETPLTLIIAALLGLLAFTFQIVAAASPAAYTGVIFAWLIGFPVIAYFMTEIYIMMLPGVVWETDASPVRGIVHALLNISPGTFVMGILNGIHPGGSALSWTQSILAVSSVLIIGFLALARRAGRVQQTLAPLSSNVAQV